LFAKSLQPVDSIHHGVQWSSPFVAARAPSPLWVQELLASHPTVVALLPARRPHPLNGVEHIIQTTGYPVFASARRLDPEKYAVAEKEFLALEAAGVIRHSHSPWASALHMVPKPMVPGGLVVIIVV
jgi:hypothetical protein